MATGIPYNSTNKNNYSLEYQGKKNKEEILNYEYSNQNKISQCNKNNSTWNNMLFFSDNIDALLYLIDEKKLSNKVNLIYIDPPFSTNAQYISRELKHAYDDKLVGTKFIEFIRERIILMYELLSKDGSIYVHLDENMAFEIKIIMDEIFGSKNFRNWITRKKCNRKNYTKNTYGNMSDYIMFYTKSNKYTWNRSYEEWSEDAVIREYPCIDEKTGKRYKKVPIHAPGIRNGKTGQQWKGLLPPEGKHWQYLPEKLDEMDRNGEIYWSPTGNPRRKIFFENSEGIPVQDIWLEFKDAHNQNIHITGYPTEKNPLLLDRIIQASSNQNDLVLDCFAGSGTTVFQAEKLERRWIGCDNSIESMETIIKRFSNGLEPMGDFVSKRNGRLEQQPELFPKEFLKSNLELYTSSNICAKDTNKIKKIFENSLITDPIKVSRNTA